MSLPSGQRGWTWSTSFQDYYYFDNATDMIVFRLGKRYKRPPNLPLANIHSSLSTQPATLQYQAPRSQPTPSHQHTSPLYQSQPRGTAPSSSRAPADSLNLAMSNLHVSGTGSITSQATPSKIQSSNIENASGSFIQSNDPQSGIQTLVQTAPLDRITDPVLLSQGIHSRGLLVGVDADTRQLFSNFKKREKPRSFFVVGRVFLVLWAESSDTPASTIEPRISIGRYGDMISPKIRRFVVLREGHNYCSALPICTYGGRGVAAKGVIKSEHSIIYTGKASPTPNGSERPSLGEAGMRETAVRVTPDDLSEKLDVMSRVDYGKPYTIHHDNKISVFGMVHPSSLPHLLRQFSDVWNSQTPASSSRSSARGVPSSPSAVSQSTSRQQSLLRSDAEKKTEAARSQTESSLNQQTQGVMAMLLKRGYTREQAAAVLKRHHEQQMARAAAANNDNYDDDDDGDDDDDDDEESDIEED